MMKRVQDYILKAWIEYKRPRSKQEQNANDMPSVSIQSVACDSRTQPIINQTGFL